jgi:RNA polymerase sigma-70 factor (ECF subfamily)
VAFTHLAAPRESPPLHRLTGSKRAHEFNRLFGDHLEGACQLAHYLTRDAERCESAIDEALRRAFRDFESYSGGSPRCWLFAIVRNRCHALEAGAGGSVSLLMREAALAGVSGLVRPVRAACQRRLGEPLETAPNSGHVRLVIEAIPDPFREPVLLKELQHLSSAEIAEVTGLPVQTVIARLALGQWMLGEELLALPFNHALRPGSFG